MLERNKYNEAIDNARKEQIEEIASYLKDFISLNASIRDLPVNSPATEEVIKEILEIPIPKEGRNPREVGDELVEKVLSHTMSIQHPRFFSMVTSAVSPYSLAGSILTDIYNPNVAGWSIAPTVGLIEEKLIKWMGSLAGYDESKCGGIFTSGGSLSNLTGMIAARENKLPGRFELPNGVAFLSDQAHSSVIKGMRMLGLRDDQIIKIETDDEFCIRLDILEGKIREEIINGRKPFLLVGSIGTTNTGSIDPINSLADIAEKYNMWLHIDGAYGGSILLSDIYKNYAKGIERADSFSWDTHKWAMQVYSCSCIIVKNKQTLITAYNEHPEYLEDVRGVEHNDGWDLGIEMSRPARCIKFWYTVQAMGTDMLSDVVDYAFHIANVAEKQLLSYDDWEITSKPMCGAITFRYAPKDTAVKILDEINEKISQEINEDGYAYVITTTLKGKKVLRLCLINANTEVEDVINTIEKLNEIAVNIKMKI